MTEEEFFLSSHPASLEEPQRLGMVVSGSLSEGLEVKLDGSVSVEAVRSGRLVAVQGQNQRFLGQITDVRLAAIDRLLTVTPPDVADPFIAQVVTGTSTYGILKVIQSLALSSSGIEEAKTIPGHFSAVTEASAADVEMAYGTEDARHFYIGNPLDMEVHLHLDLKRLVERSSGVFGKSGTGKTFLTRILLVGILQKADAVNLVFDMHDEYGWEGSQEGGARVKGLKQLFPDQVAVFTLDEESSRRRGVSTDFVVQIGYDEIEPEDMATLRETLNLTERGLDAIYELGEKYGRNWLNTFFQEDNRTLQEALGERAEVAIGTLRALRLSLNRLKSLHFLVPHAQDDSVKRVLTLLDARKNVVLEFGRYRDNSEAQVLVANLLTRRIHEHYVKRKESARGDQEGPVPLVITIEEAHKFLSPQVASQTTFGTIAREMRKYNVTLLVVDQRPSGIDPEVMSQIGTKLACLLDNEADIEAVLAGTPAKGELKKVLSKLGSKQQALVLGHAVPMPIAFDVRDYGTPQSYAELGFGSWELKQKAQSNISDLYGD
ncbi:MAG: ATP-binding protein [Chloroflexi bacterium]|nr:ATP-binding protein [Chloroflexota bacterium]